MDEIEITALTQQFTKQDLLLVEVIRLLANSSSIREKDWLEGLSKLKEKMKTRADINGDDLSYLNPLLERLMN